jgi:periplasmic divalent cation tolerance protein
MNAEGANPDDMGSMVIITTVPDEILAVKITESLLQHRFAACVHVMPAGISRYRWQGKIETSTETMLIIKTAERRYGDVQAEITRIHPYDIPEIVALPIAGGLPDYLKWIDDETQ